MGPLPQVHGEPQSMHEKRVRCPDVTVTSLLHSPHCFRREIAEKPAEPRVLSEKGLAVGWLPAPRGGKQQAGGRREVESAPPNDCRVWCCAETAEGLL